MKGAPLTQALHKDEWNLYLIMESKKLLLQKIMRITSLASVMIIAASQFLWAGVTKGQLLEKRVSLKYDKTTLYNIIEDIQRDNNVDFAFTDHLNLDKIQVNNVHFNKATLQKVLLEILPQRIVFNEQNGVITLSPLQVPGVITGVVTDETGATMIGATVKIIELNRVASTDANGRFKINVPAGSYTVEVAYISYTAQRQANVTVTAGQTSSVDFSMKAEAGNLNEVVVVGYGTQKKKEITSAITSVKADEFNQGSARSPLELIQGKVAGLNIIKTQGNNPNASASIQLRGVTSLTGTTTPLIVIDGIPGGNLDLLQQDDIESFDVLKDGSAAAIYGTRGNAGVILITTKKGSSGAPKYDYNTYFQRDFVSKRPDNLTADQFREHIAAGQISKSSDLGSSTDMYDALINKDNLSQYHNFVASGGTDKSNYRASLYYNDFQGIAKNNGRQQYGGRININQKGLKDKLTMQLNMVQNMNKANLLGGSTGDFEQAVSWNPTAPIQNPDGTYYVIQDRYNPISRFANRISERQQQTFSADGRLSLELIKDLNISAFGSYQRDNYNNRNFRSMQDYDQRPTSSYQGTAYAGKENVLTWTKTFEPTISYKKLIGGKHSVSGVVGYSYQYSTLERFNVDNNGFTTNAFLDWNLGAGSAITNTQLPRPGIGSFKEDNTLIAFFGRVNYSFNEKYFAQFILRHEGSSRFGNNNKWGNFPAASIGWTLSEESFMKNISAINSLKLRIGYGVTGNQGIPNYQSLITLGTGGVYPQGTVYYQTYGPSRNPNPNLRWEKKEEWNFGVDYSLLKNRISGSIDVYSRTTRDLLYNYTAQQPSYVLGNIYTNVGSLSNHGIEIAINAIPVRVKDFQWNVDLTANSQFNKLSKLSNDVFKATYLTFSDIPNPGAMGPAIRLDEGGQVGNFYGKRFAGFTNDGKWLFYKADGSKAVASQMNENDKTIIGNGVPKYVVGLNQTFRYKNFDLNVLLRGKFKFDILNLKEIFYGNKKYLPNNIFNSAFTRNGALNDDPQYSDYYIEKGDFVRLDNVSLGYNFKLKTLYIRNMRVFVTGRNLLTITGYKGLDPELQDTGFETGVDSRGFYPRTSSLTAGVSIGF